MIFVRFTPAVSEVEEFRRARAPRERGLTSRKLAFWIGVLWLVGFTLVNQCWIFGKCSGPRPDMSALPTAQDPSAVALATFMFTLPYLPLAVLGALAFILLPRAVGRPSHPALYRTQQAGFRDAGYVLEDGFSRVEGDWRSLYGYRDTPSLLVLYRTRGDAWFVPKRAFNDPAARGWVMWTLAARARRV